MKKMKMREIMYPYQCSTKLDQETHDAIPDIALFERKKPATWVRDIIIEATRRYQRNPQFLKFQRDLKARSQKRASS